MTMLSKEKGHHQLAPLKGLMNTSSVRISADHVVNVIRNRGDTSNMYLSHLACKVQTHHDQDGPGLSGIRRHGLIDQGYQTSFFS
jgi:hypothetical protein